MAETHRAGDRGGGAGTTAASQSEDPESGHAAWEREPQAPADGTTVAGAAVSAEGFGMKGPQGTVFQDVSFDLPAGGLGAVQGPSGSGRTCLLLALTGRMKARTGHAQVGRNRLPRQMAVVRRISALGPVAGVTDLEASLTVAEHLRERVLLEQRFGDSLRALLRPRRERTAARKALLETALKAAGLDLDSLPKRERTRVRDLERMESLRLSVALALLSRPRLLAVDDLDLKLSEEERAEAWTLLRGIAEKGTTVLAVCSHSPGDAVVIRTRGDEPKTAGSAADSEDHDGTAAAPAGRTTKGEAPDALAEARRA